MHRHAKKHMHRQWVQRECGIIRPFAFFANVAGRGTDTHGAKDVDSSVEGTGTWYDMGLVMHFNPKCMWSIEITDGSSDMRAYVLGRLYAACAQFYRITCLPLSIKTVQKRADLYIHMVVADTRGRPIKDRSPFSFLFSKAEVRTKTALAQEWPHALYGTGVSNQFGKQLCRLLAALPYTQWKRFVCAFVPLRHQPRVMARLSLSFLANTMPNGMVRVSPSLIYCGSDSSITLSNDVYDTGVMLTEDIASVFFPRWLQLDALWNIVAAIWEQYAKWNVWCYQEVELERTKQTVYIHFHGQELVRHPKWASFLFFVVHDFLG